MSIGCKRFIEGVLWMRVRRLAEYGYSVGACVTMTLLQCAMNVLKIP